MKDGFYISTDKSKLNGELIHRFLSQDSYWAKGRTPEIVKKSIDNSLCFGVYKENEQVGFARVVSDYSVFAWILDVFILPDYRKNGLGKLLMEAIRSHPDLQNLKRWGLTTEDAHGLYEQFGFKPVKNSNFYMEIISKPFTWRSFLNLFTKADFIFRSLTLSTCSRWFALARIALL